MSKRYSAFTLVEMLIVMGILIILMAVGITAGRFAINRANDVAHQNAADQIYTALQAYYTDAREFPIVTGELVDFGTAIAEGGLLYDYMSEGEFTGGTDATFYYYTDTTTQQEVLICVSLGGLDDATDRGYYCTGNAFGSTGVPGGIANKSIDPEGAVPPSGYPGGAATAGEWLIIQDWADEEFAPAV